MKKNLRIYISTLVLFSTITLSAQQLAVLHYGGGGDWYSNPTALPNLVAYCNTHLGMKLNPEIAEVKDDDPQIFSYPYVHMTGHGNVFFSETAINNLRKYLNSGGFLHIDDNYGMDLYLRPQLKLLFPEDTLVEIPSKHKLFKTPYNFSEGLPKIHEHDSKRPQALGIFRDGRLVLLYTFESDLGDGWESPEVHNDPPQVRENALRMGANILNYAFEY